MLNQGIRNAARFEMYLVFLKVAIVLLVIVVGVFSIDAGNYNPFTPFGLTGAFTGAATLFADVGLPFLGAIIAGGAILGILTVLFTFLMGASRVGYSMSRDGLLPAWIGQTNARTGAPSRSTWILGVAAALIAGFLPIGQAAELTNIGILLAFVVVCIAVVATAAPTCRARSAAPACRTSRSSGPRSRCG